MRLLTPTDIAAQIGRWFRPVEATPEQQDRMAEITHAAGEFAEVVLLNTPVCADQAAAVRKIREAMQTALEAALEWKEEEEKKCSTS